MATKYDWDFIRPMDQTASIAALAQGNQQVLAGLQGISGGVTGYSDALKQRNTDSILNALTQAQTSADLPVAMNAVQALQQQFGRGYDQTAVRNAVDTRGSTLAQRDMQNINLQQAQAQQEALPQLNAMNIERMRMAGATPEQIAAMQGIQGVDTTTQATAAINDLRNSRDFNYRAGRDAVSDEQWAAGNNRANLQTAASLAKEFVTPSSTGYGTDANGNIVTVGTQGVSFADALPLMNSLFQVESNGRHTDRNGNLTRSPKGALGIAQIMPATAAKPGYGMQPINLQNTSPEQQKQWATQYISRIQQAHNFTTEQAVAAYNAGPGAVQKAIKSGGANWLSKLPKETRDYVPKVLGQTQGATASQARQAVGAIIPQADMSKVTSSYQDSIAKLNADYTAQSAKDKIKGSIATTGKNVDTWATSKNDRGMVLADNNTWFTNASDLANMAKADKNFSSLPESAQINILEGAYAKMNDVNAFQYVKDGDLKKFISTESQNYTKNRTNEFNQAKQAAFESGYQNLVQLFQSRGSTPPSREAAKQLLDPSYKPKAKEAPKPKAASKPQPKSSASSGIPFPLRTNGNMVQSELDKLLNKYGTSR